jgi:hypothetical protein
MNNNNNKRGQQRNNNYNDTNTNEQQFNNWKSPEQRKEGLAKKSLLNDAIGKKSDKMTSAKILERRKRFGVHEEIQAPTISGKKGAPLELNAEQLAKRERLLAMVKKNSASTSTSSASSMNAAPKVFKSKKWMPPGAAENASKKKTLSNSLPTTP